MTQHVPIPAPPAEPAELLDEEPVVGRSTLARLSAAWPRRATIRTDLGSVTDPGPYDPALLDYPSAMLPFADHPDYLAATEEQRAAVNTTAWLGYNERVIAAEEFVANPTFEKLAHGVFPGVDRWEVKEAVQQSHVDEVWHTYMHMLAMRRTRENRRPAVEPDYGQPVTNRRLYALADTHPERWQRDLLYLLWTAVGEISINGFLDLLARAEGIQPMHCLVARLHARDEAAHGPVLYELMREIYPRLGREQREFVIRELPGAITAFGAEDFDLFRRILETAGVRKAAEIVEDTRRLPGNELMMNDFSTVQRLLGELGIEDRVEYDFR